MNADYPDTHYRRLAGTLPAPVPLTGRLECDVCVVGGGLAGLSAALSLATRGRRVVLLEARRIGYGASGRNGGFVTAGFALSAETLLARAGRDDGRRLYALSREGVALVRNRIAAFGIAAAQPVSGAIVAWRYPAGDEVLRTRDRLRECFGVEREVWPVERVRGALRSARYFEALADGEGLHMDPLAYALGLARALEAHGARVHEASPVTTLRRMGATLVACTAHGAVHAAHVVLATSAYGEDLHPRLAAATLPVATYMIATQALGPRLATAIDTDAAVADTRNAGDYYRAREGRILWGGRMTALTREPRRLAALLLADVVGVYPQLAGVRVETAWSGLMGYSRHRMPLLLELEPGLWSCTNFGGHGLNTTAIAGELVARAITGEDDELRRFARFGTAWTGGPLGALAAESVYRAYVIADRWRERHVH